MCMPWHCPVRRSTFCLVHVFSCIVLGVYCVPWIKICHWLHFFLCQLLGWSQRAHSSCHSSSISLLSGSTRNSGFILWVLLVCADFSSFPWILLGNNGICTPTPGCYSFLASWVKCTCLLLLPLSSLYSIVCYSSNWSSNLLCFPMSHVYFIISNNDSLLKSPKP